MNMDTRRTPTNSLTHRLQQLLEYFEDPKEPREDMITYIDPEKTNKRQLPIAHNYDRHDPRLTVVSSFGEDSIREIPAEQVVPMPKSLALVQVKNDNEILKLSGGKYRAHERHHFVKIRATSFVSCATPTGAYSEIAIVLWVDSKNYSKSLNDRYRIVLSMMYDSEEDLWNVSSKLIKRVAYYSKDEEEGQISGRLCLTSELRSEIKKMLLYLGISPRDAFRKFRRNMAEELVITESEFGFTTVENASHSSLLKDLEKTSTTTTATTGWDPHRQNYNGNHHVSRHRGRVNDPDLYKDAMLGYSVDDCYGSD